MCIFCTYLSPNTGRISSAWSRNRASDPAPVPRPHQHGYTGHILLQKCYARCRNDHHALREITSCSNPPSSFQIPEAVNGLAALV